MHHADDATFWVLFCSVAGSALFGSGNTSLLPDAEKQALEPNDLPHHRIVNDGSAAMRVQTYEVIQGIVQSRRLLQQTTDRSTKDSLRNYIAELERRLLLEMHDAPPDQAGAQARN